MPNKSIIFGLLGPTLTQEERELFQKNPEKVKGVILFKRNITGAEQLKLLVKDIKSVYEDPLVIFVDQEGGRVARLREPLAKEYPPAESFGKLYDKNPEEAIHQVKENYSSVMKVLQVYQMNSPCAPVADLRYSWADKVIGNRSFGSQVSKVVDLCNAAITGITKEGGTAIIKHMPGHGRAICDSHYHLPVIDTPLNELQETDFEVFRQLSTHNQDIWAMTAHIIYEALDPKNPVTLSKKAIEFIREDIGFKGTLITDDICMHALHKENCTPYFLAKQLLALLENQGTDDPKYDEIRAQFIAWNIITDTLGPLEQKQQLMDKLPKLKEIFTQSVAEVAAQAIAAGCNIVLHCSGDLQEMTAICEVV